jgi:hypothetical protein
MAKRGQKRPAVEPIPEHELAVRRRELRRSTCRLLRQALDDDPNLSTRMAAERIGRQSEAIIIRATKEGGFNLSLDSLADVATALGKRARVVLEDL